MGIAQGQAVAHGGGARPHTVAAGLIMAGVLALFNLSGGDLLTGAVMVGVAGVLTWKKKMHPFPLLIAGAVAFEAAYLLGYLKYAAS